MKHIYKDNHNQKSLQKQISMCPARPRILLLHILQQLHSHCYCITAADRKRCGCRAQEDTVSTNTSTKTGKSRLGNCQGWAGLGWAAVKHY